MYQIIINDQFFMTTLDFNFCRSFTHTIKKNKNKKINENSSKKEIEDNEKTQMKYNNYHKEVHIYQ